MIQPNSNFGWMRTVTKEEGEQCLNNMMKWAATNRQPAGGSIGEWIYQPLHTVSEPIKEFPKNESNYTMSLTPKAAQRNWRTPTEFPCTPTEINNNPLEAYAENLKVGNIFSQNTYSTSLIINSAISQDRQTLFVLTRSKESDDAIKGYALSQITYEDGLFIHTGRTFFTKEGAEKQFTLAQGLEWTGEDSIDDYC